jgi:hypothetical protein
MIKDTEDFVAIVSTEYSWDDCDDPAPPRIVSPEQLVFGQSSGESSPSNSATSLSCAEGAVEKLEEKKRKNTEAAARYRRNKRIREEQEERIKNESEHKLKLENDSLRALNRALTSQLVYFQNLFRDTSRSPAASTILPTLEDDSLLVEGESFDFSGDTGRDCGRMDKNMVCQAVFFLAVLSLSGSELHREENTFINAPHHGRILLWEKGSNSFPDDSALGLEMYDSAKLPGISMGILGLVFKVPSPFSSSAATLTCLAALRTCTAIWLVYLLCRIAARSRVHLYNTWAEHCCSSSFRTFSWETLRETLVDRD